MPDLPQTSIELHALGHLARALEARFPGLLDEWVDTLQDEALLNEIVRLRGPRESEHVRAVRVSALTWAKHVRLITLAMMAPGARIRPPRRRAARRPGSGSQP